MIHDKIDQSIDQLLLFDYSRSSESAEKKNQKKQAAVYRVGQKNCTRFSLQ